MKRFLRTLALLLVIAGLTLSLAGCGQNQQQQGSETKPAGELTVFHAGSLSVPFKAVADAFMKKYPQVTVKLVSAGSKALAQKIITLHEQGYDLPEIYASADYTLISEMIMPKKLSDFNVLFAKNAIVLAYTDDSKYADEINADNWYKILQRPDVVQGRSDPDKDPCGYRALIVMQLAEKYYNTPGLYEKLKEHPKTVIKPKEVDLVADLETGAIDYFWIYESVARQHHFKYIKLPDKINLSSVKYADFYKTASVELTGITVHGKPIVYGITALSGPAHPELAQLFMKFLLTDGLKIIEMSGQPTINPPEIIGETPAWLKDIIKPAQQ